MENFINFIVNNYVWILTITIILLFALIGYIYDYKKSEKDYLNKAEKEIEENALSSINNEVSLNSVIENNNTEVLEDNNSTNNN